MNLLNIPKAWQVVTVGEIASKESGSCVTGPFGSTIGRKFWVEKGVPIIRGNNLTVNREKFIDAGYVFVSEDYAKNQMKRYHAVTNDLIFTAAGTIGQIGIIPEVTRYPFYIISNKQMRLRVDLNIVNPLFAYYYFRSKFFFNLIQNNNTGSTIPLINVGVLRSLPFPLPPLSEQNEIAATLSSLDNKIELNIQMNKTLEETAMAIFKEWFIDFGAFREGEFVDSALGPIPKGWSLTSFGGLLDLLKDGSHNPPKRSANGVKFIAGATDIKNFIIGFEKCTYIDEEDYQNIHKKWEAKENDVLMTIVGTIGNTAIVRKCDLPFSFQRSIAIFRARMPISSFYIYLLINSKLFKEYLNSRTNPTAQPGVYLGTISEFQTISPPDEIHIAFHDKIHHIFKLMQENYSEIQSLTEIKDYVLPKLVCGEIEIKER